MEVNRYTFKDDDLNQVINFVKNYHLNPTKGSRGRTNQGKRGFGGELDEFVPGKLLELAVCRILERMSGNKTLLPDFEIYSDSDVGKKSDPDITKVIEKNINQDRQPNVFVEIKRLDPSSRFLGPRVHQLKDMTKGYMVHASIGFKNDIDTKLNDVTAIILKNLLRSSNNFNLNEFQNFSDLFAQIEYVYSFETLRNQGHFFESGNIIPDTDFPCTNSAYTKKGDLRKNYEVEYKINGEKDINMFWGNKDEILSFSKWSVSGDFEIIKNQYKKRVIYAKKNVEMFSKVFGKFKLINDKTYRFHFTNTLGTQAGKDVFKSIDDYWFSKKRLDELLNNEEIDNTFTALQKISLNI